MRNDAVTDEEDKHELCSEAWVEAARVYLENALAQLGPEVEGARFSLCEVFTDAPPHLADGAGGQVGWWFTIDGPRVEVGHGVRHDVEPRVVVDYQSVLPLVRTLYSENPQAAEAARERRRKAVERGEAPPFRLPPPELVPMLMGLHDHMAVRTR
jgi:hypothetical protein